MKTTYWKTLIAGAIVALCNQAFAQSTAEHPTTPPPPPEAQAPEVERLLAGLKKRVILMGGRVLITRIGRS